MRSTRWLSLVYLVGCALDGATRDDRELITPPVSCLGADDCAAAQHCSVDDGDCASPPCLDFGACPAVCAGVCVSDGPSVCEEPKIAGEWSGAGTVERRYHFAADGSFDVEDRVSPCPEDVVCVWSGIIFKGGTWSEDGDRVRLTYAPPIVSEPGLAYPTSLAIVG